MSDEVPKSCMWCKYSWMIDDRIVCRIDDVIGEICEDIWDYAANCRKFDIDFESLEWGADEIIKLRKQLKFIKERLDALAKCAGDKIVRKWAEAAIVMMEARE